MIPRDRRASWFVATRLDERAWASARARVRVRVRVYYVCITCVLSCKGRERLLSINLINQSVPLCTVCFQTRARYAAEGSYRLGTAASWGIEQQVSKPIYESLESRPGRSMPACRSSLFSLVSLSSSPSHFRSPSSFSFLFFFFLFCFFFLYENDKETVIFFVSIGHLLRWHERRGFCVTFLPVDY